MSSAPRLRACSVPERSRQKAGCGRDGPWGTADRAHLPPRGEPWGHGAPGGLRAGRATVAGGAGRKRRAPSLAARRESDELMDSSQKYVYMHHCLPELSRWVGIRSSAALPQPGRRPPGGPTAAPPCPARARSAPIHSRARYTPDLQSAWASHPPTSSSLILCPSNHFLLMRKNSFMWSDQNGECRCDLSSCQMWTEGGETSQAEYLSGFGRFLFSTFFSIKRAF